MTKNFKTFYLFVFCLLGTISLQAQIITGTVKDKSGETLPGVSVVVKGTTTGTSTDLDGKFSLDVQGGKVVEFSMIGSANQEITVGESTSDLNIVMQDDMMRLNEVVVTAMGIKKKEKSLTYSSQVMGGDELTRAKDPNMINSLAGKTAGVVINKSSSGLGGSAKVVIRGNRSAKGSNQPLYVIDGVPMNSDSNDQTASSIGGTNDSGNRDGGDGISNLNPDDIESMNILKGPGAAALYGSRAANGVVVIVTKKGKSGRTTVNFNTSTTIDNVAYGKPDFQNSYTGVTSSWGDKTSQSANYLKDYFKTGVTTINSVSLSAGTDKMQTYFSYANTYGKGIVEGNTLNKHNLNFRETAKFFDDKLTVDANINLMFQNVKNRMTPGGLYMNPLVGLYSFPRGGSTSGGATFEHYKNNYQKFDANRNLYTQDWYTDNDMNQNPYWLLNKTPSEDRRIRTLSNLTLSYKLNDYFNIQARGTADYISDKYNQKMYVGTHKNLAGANGRYITHESTPFILYGDMILTYQRNFNDNFALNAVVGASINDRQEKSIRLDSRPGSLFFPNIFTVANMNLNEGNIVETDVHVQEQAVFGSAQFAYKDRIFLDITGRNDWSSTLAYTNNMKSGFFYPSVGLTYLLHESITMPSWINFAKFRGTWSKVGNALPSYISYNPNNPVHNIGAGGVKQEQNAAPFSELKPEMTTAIEFGTEFRFFNNRMDFDFTYYKTNTKNQLFDLPAPAGSGYNIYYINAGNIENKGIEVVLGGSPIMTKDFRWKTSINFSKNKNKIIELADDLPFFPLSALGSNSYQMRLEKGGSFGDLYGIVFERDAQGKVILATDGMPTKSTDFKKVANTAPDFNLGWSNTLSYKGVSLYILIDGRFGGDVMSLTQAELDLNGASEVTGSDRDAGYVMFEGNKITDVQKFYTTVGGRGGVSEYYIYSATNIRLREVSIGYTLPKDLFKTGSVIKGCEFSLIGRNLFFFKNDAPYDPDASMSTGNGLQGIDVFGAPTNRSFGVNVKLSF